MQQAFTSTTRGAERPRVFVSAAHKSSGKTTLTLGLAAALAQREHIVQPFKKGPDYIDPLWLGMAAGRPCYNLDFHMMQRDEIAAQFARAAEGARISLVEGNKGLYDGLDLDGSNSNAALARLLDAPVVLVIDARGMTRGVAPLILGYQAFDRDIRIAGVILNQLGGSRHESKLRAVIEHYTDVEVLGAVQHDDAMQIAERHLGLVPANEQDVARARIRAVGERIAGQVDLGRLLAIADTAPSFETFAAPRQRVCGSVSHRTRHSGFTTVKISTACVRPMSSSSPWTCCTMPRCPQSTASSSEEVFPKCSWMRSKPTPVCVPACAPPSRPACRPMPNAAV